MPPMPSDTLVIVPTYNERENLEALATEVLARLPTADLLVVDDNSPEMCIRDRSTSATRR